MQTFTNTRNANTVDEIWVLQHSAVYTLGQAGDPAHILNAGAIPIVQSDRGGQVTYHGPGQRVAYAMLDLRKRGRDVSAFVRGLEQWMIDALASFEVTAERRCGRVGVWVVRENGEEEKIAAIGVRLKKWVSFHGISINVNPDLSHFGGIVPCGIQEHGVASLASLGKDISMSDMDAALQSSFGAIFGPVDQA